MNIEKPSNNEEKIIKSITVEQPNFSDGLQDAINFLRKIKEEHPEQHYPEPSLLEGYNPVLTQLFVAKSENTLAGILLGSADQLGFNGKVLIVDPKYANTDAADKLIESIKEKYRNIRLTPQPLVWKRGRVTERTNALARYYERLGFHNSGTGLMTWERDENQQTDI